MKNSILLLLLLISLAWGHTLTAQNRWNALSIPAEMKEKAHAVIRLDETNFQVKSPGLGTLKRHLVVTVLDAEGAEHAQLVFAYTKLNKLIDLEGVLYDALGEKVRKLKKDNIGDYGGVQAMNLFDDVRFKVAEFNYANFPFTVEFTYELQDKQLTSYQRWFPHSSPSEVSIESSKLTIEIPENLAPLRYKEVNGIAPVQNSKTEKGNLVYTWSVKNLAAHEVEDFMPKWLKRGPGVMAAPSIFEMDGYKGDFSTWQKVGEFDNILGQGRDVLDAQAIEDIKAFTKNETTTLGKVQKVYEYLQQKTRYISIQLGIGGLQPFPAQYVAEKGYGDCKALSNYTKALLKALDINSYYTSIQAGDGEPDILTDFPAQQFNHVILCVPIKQDTVWLECTSQTNAFGYMSAFTSNRHALLATPQGGVLVKTPALTSKDNLIKRNITMTISATGETLAKFDIDFKGIFHDDYEGLMLTGNTDEQIEYLHKSLHLANASFKHIAWKQDKARVPSLKLNCEVNLKKTASLSGSRLFITPNIFFSEDYQPSNPNEERKHPIEIVNTYSYQDEFTIQLPSYQTVEALPPNVNITSKFGVFKTEYRLQEGKLIVTRYFERKNGLFQASEYNEMLEFYKKIAKADRAQMVLKL